MLGPFLLLSTLFINEENQPLVPAAGCSLCCCSRSTWPRAWNVPANISASPCPASLGHDGRTTLQELVNEHSAPAGQLRSRSPGAGKRKVPS